MPFLRSLRRLARDTAGNFATSTTIILLPLLMVIGLAMDYNEASNGRQMLQADMDVAALSGAKILSSGSATKGIETAQATLVSLASGNPSYRLEKYSVAIDGSGTGLSLDATAQVTPAFLSMFGADPFVITLTSRIGSSTVPSGYVDVNIVMDKTMSMLVAATRADALKMDQMMVPPSELWGGAPTSCAFACHKSGVAGGGGVWNGTTYENRYDFARAAGVRLRADVQAEAVASVLDLLDQQDPAHERIRVNLFTLGSDADPYALIAQVRYGDQQGYALDDVPPYRTADGIRQVLGPTFDLSAVRTALATNPELAVGKGYTTSDFRSLKDLAPMVTRAGDGKSASQPKQLVILITDGVQSSETWVFGGGQFITPLNPVWCQPLKDRGATVAVLYTQYSPMPGNVAYDSSIGNPLSLGAFQQYWEGVLPSPPNMKGIDFLPGALSKCASSPDFFLAASMPTEIVKGLTDLASKGLDVANGGLRFTN